MYCTSTQLKLLSEHELVSYERQEIKTATVIL